MSPHSIEKPYIQSQPRHRGVVLIQQRTLPHYRVPFFDHLATLLEEELHVFAGNPAGMQSVKTNYDLHKAHFQPAINRSYGSGKLVVYSQSGLVPLLRRLEPDVLIVEANPRVISTASGIRWMRKRHQPVIGWGLGVLPWVDFAPLLPLRRGVLGRFYRQFDALLCYSTKGARDYESLGVASERIFIAPNAVSSRRADEVWSLALMNPHIVTEWRNELGLSNRPVILYVGRLIPSKRASDLIEACSTFRDACELVIIGEGPDSERLRNIARDKFPNTRFLGYLDGEALAKAIAVSDLFVMPGTGGLALQEIMAYGKPAVVASGDGTQLDLIRDGVNGFHISAGDVVSLSTILNRMISEPILLKSMGNESRSIIEKEHNLDIMAHRFVKAISYVTNVA